MNSMFCQNANKSNLVSRKVLLENYGGTKCGNCPLANSTALQMENIYGNDIAIINIHAGFYANPNSTYPTDLRTQCGNDWDMFFGISNAGNPNGMVCRKDYSSNHIKFYTSWQSEIVGIIGQSAIAEISISHSFINSLMNVDVKTKFFVNTNNRYKLITVLTEDSVIATQLDYSLPSGSQVNSSYVHYNVLRESLFGSWGTLLNSSSVSINDSITKSVSNYSVSSNYNPNNLNIVAFIYDTLTYEVMQVQKVGIQSIITGIVSNSHKFNLIISPNPTNSTLSITSSFDYDTVKIINSIGQTVLIQENKQEPISVSNLSNGIYFIQLLDKKETLLRTEKFIKE